MVEAAKESQYRDDVNYQNPCIGIALGSFNACTGFLDSTNDVVILETPLSGRKTPLYILFKQDETREIGKFAIEEIEYNLRATFQYFTRILCKNNVESENRFLSYKTTEEGQIVD